LYVAAIRDWKKNGEMKLPAIPACANGLDDDGDGVADFDGVAGKPGDKGCVGLDDESENEPTLGCDDGQDNDKNGRADYMDEKCYLPANKTVCDNPRNVCRVIDSAKKGEKRYFVYAPIKNEELSKPEKKGDAPASGKNNKKESSDTRLAEIKKLNESILARGEKIRKQLKQ
jgi:hypothetical protein